ncbi:MAG: hypothetical protein MZV70_38245 [Desulfobacterales bacterium]|nr:hypothetical protein [Desulfobacterales bacterium]
MRRIIDHPDLTLVGLYVYGKNKIGRDAGEIAKRPSTGVIATNNLEEILSLDADVVVHTPASPSPMQNRMPKLNSSSRQGKTSSPSTGTSIRKSMEKHMPNR